ncbi:MAG: FAD-dependent oxidoreductase [Hyphomicrobiales bacterium]|nr:FAD-dependent oxidoreductase [Hyphomicrobiales bacterium]
MSKREISTRCCIVGGGPCGLMLGFLLARAGVDVVVLEKHADFLRDFRGDTVHPSTLQVVAELGLLDQFLQLPHQKAFTIGAFFGDKEYAFADFRHLPSQAKFIAIMPQWDFLNFLADQGQRFPTFRVIMRAEVQDLIEEGGRIVGVRAATPEGALAVRAGLTVGCDGRHSTVRARAGLVGEDIGAPMDVLWFRLPRRPGDPDETMGRFEAGRIVILINRGDYWQCAFIIRKGSIEETRRAGLPAFRQSVARLVPVFADRVDELKEWDQIKLLTVAVNRLERWYKPGLLCIGDAAHAMSPIGGVGVNLAVQDAVAAANLLWQPLTKGELDDADLERVQRQRAFPTRLTQRLQVLIQNKVIDPALDQGTPLEAPLPLRLFTRFPVLRRLPARLIGLGVRPEHVQPPARAPLAEAPPLAPPLPSERT